MLQDPHLEEGRILLPFVTSYVGTETGLKPDGVLSLKEGHMLR